MQEISNSLRQRLKARPEPKVHPDPELLTAYIERALSAAERSRVVQHLAECGYCREIVALSLPEPPPEQAATAPEPRRSWWIPAYRWAAAAATIAIAATLVVEKPWKDRPNQFQQGPATASSNSSLDSGKAPEQAKTQPDTASAIAARAAMTEAPKPTTPASTALTRTGGGAAGPTLRDDRAGSLNPSPNLPGVAEGTIGQPKASSPESPPPQRVVVARSESTLAAKAAETDAGKDYVNRSILSKQAAEVSEAKLPEAPLPREAAANQDAGTVRKNTPRLSSQDLATNQMNLPVVPPETQATAAAPSPTDSTLAKSGGFAYGLKSGLNKAVNKTVVTVRRATGSRPTTSSETFVSPSSISSLSATAGLSAADQESARPAPERIHWSITSDGRLLRSTDVGQWHQAYAEGSDIQFRVVQPHGSEVWAGGNHGTLIHSWNAGVDWSKMNVPDSTTSDITGISIDGDNVQVKTSNGQTFVSPDHGKTWVPLQQQPQ